MAKKTPKLVYDKSEEGWMGTVQLSAFADCAVRWDVDDEGIDGPHKTEQTKAQRTKIPVVILCQKGEEPTDVQRSSLKRFLDRQVTIGKRLLKYALKELSNAYYAESLPSLADCTGKEKTTRKRFNTVAGFQELIEPTCVYVLEEEQGGVSYLAVDFFTALDEEHGFSVLLHDGKPLDWAGAGEMGGDIPPPEESAIDLAEFNRVVAAHADALLQFADLLKSATNEETAHTVVEQIPPLLEKIITVTNCFNDHINDKDLHARVIKMKALNNDSNDLKVRQKYTDQITRIVKDRQLDKIFNPALADLPGWKNFRKVTRKYG